jgi:hypothetical protein
VSHGERDSRPAHQYRGRSHRTDGSAGTTTVHLQALSEGKRGHDELPGNKLVLASSEQLRPSQLLKSSALGDSVRLLNLEYGPLNNTAA